MYCLKCRHVTESEIITTATSKNGRQMWRVQCITCRKTKTQFVKKGTVGESFLKTWVNKLIFEMHLPVHIFTGSETKLYKRLNLDGTPKKSSTPINRVDTSAYHHDLSYSKHSDTKTRNDVCDKTMLNELDGIMNQILRERIDKSIPGKLIKANVNFGLGHPVQKKI